MSNTACRQPITGVVLAGGSSQRMGRDKAALVLDGETLLARVARILREALGDVIVVGPPDRAVLAPAIRLVPDESPGQGPLGGILSALHAVTTPFIFVAACDMPYLRSGLVRHLASLASADVDIVVPRSTRGTEQLCAVYGRGCLAAIAVQLATADRAIARLYDRVRTREVAPEEWAPYDPTGVSFINLNTPDDWTNAQAARP